MPQHAHRTIDKLLGDSLIQAVMRADKVEPQAVKTLLADAADRMAASRAGEPKARRAPHARRPVRLQANAGSCGCEACC